MGKITRFDWNQFIEAREMYDDMMCDIEERIMEIAQYMGEKYQIYQLSDIAFSHDQYNEYVTAEMHMDEKDENGEDKYEYYKVNVKWLFSDDFKQELDAQEIAKRQKEAMEYQEYLRLKKKFEGR